MVHLRKSCPCALLLEWLRMQFTGLTLQTLNSLSIRCLRICMLLKCIQQLLDPVLKLKRSLCFVECGPFFQLTKPPHYSIFDRQSFWGTLAMFYRVGSFASFWKKYNFAESISQFSIFALYGTENRGYWGSEFTFHFQLRKKCRENKEFEYWDNKKIKTFKT